MRTAYPLLLLLAACATGHWEKPGAMPADADADLSSCTTTAQTAPSLPPLRTTSSAIEMRTTPAGAPAGVSVPPAGAYGDSDRRLEQAQRVDSCMRQKGYTLRRD